MATVEYYEEQKFTQKWIFFIQYFLALVFLGVSLAMILTKQASPVIGILPFVILCVAILFFKVLKLQTKITNEGIYYRFSPVQRKYRVIKKSAIAGIRIKTYDPIGEYGGWGIRFGREGKAFTVKGNQGIFITANNKHIMIGTCRPAEAEQFLEENQYHPGESKL